MYTQPAKEVGGFPIVATSSFNLAFLNCARVCGIFRFYNTSFSSSIWVVVPVAPGVLLSSPGWWHRRLPVPLWWERDAGTFMWALIKRRFEALTTFLQCRCVRSRVESRLYWTHFYERQCARGSCACWSILPELFTTTASPVIILWFSDVMPQQLLWCRCVEKHDTNDRQ